MVDWFEQPGFLRELEALVADAPCRIPASARYMARGYREPAEARPGLARQLPGIAIGVASHDQLPNRLAWMRMATAMHAGQGPHGSRVDSCAPGWADVSTAPATRADYRPRRTMR